MAMRNFWINGKVDGRKTRITGGPKKKDGGIDLEVRIRDKGYSKMVVGINGWYEEKEDKICMTINFLDPNTNIMETKHIEVDRG